MNTAAQIAKLETLLERIERNRRPVPTEVAAAPSATRAAPAPSPAAPAPLAPPAAAPFVEEATGERAAPPKPTPMEMALEGVGLESSAPDDVELEITVDEGPEIRIDEDELAEAAPAAPAEPVADTPPSMIPRPIEGAPASPSGPVARVVSRRAPTAPSTFGDLLERTLALRPR